MRLTNTLLVRLVKLFPFVQAVHQPFAEVPTLHGELVLDELDCLMRPYFVRFAASSRSCSLLVHLPEVFPLRHYLSPFPVGVVEQPGLLVLTLETGSELSHLCPVQLFVVVVVDVAAAPQL